jgi:pyruvate/2-oxoglutarate dehydrogenase complex dihydrolipoamide dehydrogenase (E3) component
MQREYDAVILGSGQAGQPLAFSLARAGWKTALVEREFIGGSCVNWGCTPTKTLVASARVAHLARRASEYGVEVGSVAVDLLRVQERQRQIVASFRDGGRRALERTAGVDLLFGEGRFLGPRRVAVELRDGGSLELEAKSVFIDTGTRSTVPPLPGLEAGPFLDNRSILELAELPRRLLVLGGGYIGLEFGQMFRRFGSEVSIVQRGAQLLAREDADVADAVAEILRQDGIEVLLRATARQVARPAGEAGEIELEVEVEGEQRTLRGSHLLVAVGRTPNSDRLDLAAGGVEADERGFIRVDEQLRTTAPGVYALGDVKGGPAFTHISYDDFRIVRANLLHGGGATTRGRMVPYTVFLDPQLGRVGLGESEAREQGRTIRVAKLEMTRVARAIEAGETRGFMKAVVDAGSGEILGCAVLGMEGGEIVSMLQVAMMGRLPYPVLKEAIFAHPTLAESLNNLFATLD